MTFLYYTCILFTCKKGGGIVTDSILQKYSQDSKKLAFDANGEIRGVYRGVIEEDDPFTPGDKRLVYKVEGEDKVQRSYPSKSKRLAKAFYESNAKDGDKIEIMRFGEGFETVYRVKIVSKNQTEEKKNPEDLPF